MVFHVDLDNTLIYSYKHEIGPDTLEVELYEGRNISYVTRRTYDMLQALKDRLILVPTTTRTVEQYQRIDLHIGSFPYALVCNGGILLADGKRDEDWYRESLESVSECQADILAGIKLLEQDSRRIFEVRYIEQLFVFTKCSEPQSVVGDLKERLDTSRVDVFSNGAKVYILPKTLTKGNALKRFQKHIGAQTVFAAGDSEFDISMLEAADAAFAPQCLKGKIKKKADVHFIDERHLFSEELLREVLQRMENCL